MKKIAQSMIDQYLKGIHKTKLIRCLWSLLERNAE